MGVLYILVESMSILRKRTCPENRDTTSASPTSGRVSPGGQASSSSVDHHLLRVQAFAISHALEDDLPPDADDELGCFLFEDLWRKLRSAMSN